LGLKSLANRSLGFYSIKTLGLPSWKVVAVELALTCASLAKHVGVELATKRHNPENDLYGEIWLYVFECFLCFTPV
jgi:hypothetical protein